MRRAIRSPMAIRIKAISTSPRNDRDIPSPPNASSPTKDTPQKISALSAWSLTEISI